MTLRSLVKNIFLFPLRPLVVDQMLRVFRTVGFLPRRIRGKWPPERILVVNPTHTVGDAFMMLPFLDALHHSCPGAKIDLIAEPPMAGPLQSVPYLKRVFNFSPKVPKNLILRSYLHFFAMLRFARRELRAREYDLALLPRWGTDPYLLTYLASMSTAPRRGGHDPEEEELSDYPLPSMDRLLTMVARGGAGMAEGVRQQLLLVACGFVDEIPASEEFRPVESAIAMTRGVALDACMERIGLSPDDPFILLAPGASYAFRRWPTERFAALGTMLHEATGAVVCSIGSAGDRGLGSEIEALSGGLIRNLAGETSLLESMALTHRAQLVVANDSGPAHMGGSLGVRTLVLSAWASTSLREHPNSPVRVRPVGPRVVVLQPEQPASGCVDQCLQTSAHCILGITTDVAGAAALSLYSRP